MNTAEFFNLFKTESDCQIYLKSVRDKVGVTCKKCQGKKHWWLASKFQYQCTSCDFRTTLKSGTVMESSNLSLLTWFHGMYLMVYTKKRISACELQRQLSIGSYVTAWYMAHKLRRAMSMRDDRYKLDGQIEVDDAFIPL